jgi:hypothetical protein
MDNSIHWLAPVYSHASTPTQYIELGTGYLTLHTPLHDRIIAIKNDIDRTAPASLWDDAKKITNLYEYIFLSLQRRMHRSVAAIVPLSRSYFKMIELWDGLGLNAITRTAHSAEGPGGFLEAIQHRVGSSIPMTAMTLKSTERTVPGWRKSQAFLSRYPHITVTYGADGTGNLYNLENQEAFTAIAPAAANLYTADGGFDFSADYNGQENTVQRLLIAEALAGLTTLQVGGTMIIKMFDTKHRATLELMWVLSTCFERTALMKPYTSRPANSERYWIGSGLRVVPAWVITLFRRLTDTDAPVGWNQFFATEPWATDWLSTVQQFQEALEEQQLDKIQMTLNLIRAPNRSFIQQLLTENIRNSRTWCLAHRIPINPDYVNLTDEQVTGLILEEALEPFPAVVGRTGLPGVFPREQMHHGSTSGPVLRPPVAPAWRSALPQSILSRTSSQINGDIPLLVRPGSLQFHPGSWKGREEI